MWLFYVLGAVGGSIAKHWWGPGALALPVSALGIVLVIDLLHPRTAAETSAGSL